MNRASEYLPGIFILLVFAQFTFSSIAQRIRRRRLDPESLRCPHCHGQGAENPTISSLGALRLTCLSCSRSFKLPLPTGMKVAYAFITLLFVLWLAVAIPVFAKFWQK